MLALVAGLELIACGSAAAAPPGRAWIPQDALRVPGHTFIISDRLEINASGTPLAFAAIVGGIGYDTYGFRWADSSWVTTWQLGYGVTFLRPVLAPPGRSPMIWKGLDQVGESGLMSSLVMAEAFGDSVTVPDTVAMVYVVAWGYSAAVANPSLPTCVRHRAPGSLV